jgi:hypothetical protein
MKEMLWASANVVMLVVRVDSEAKRICESDMFLVVEVMSPQVSA